MRFFLLLAILCIASCRFSEDDYEQAVKSGFAVIPQSLEIERFFGEADHFISYFGFKTVANTWNTEVYFAGHYRLTLQVDVKISDGTVVETISPAVFYLDEFERFELQANGQVMARIKKNWTFNQADWKKVVSADGDLSVVGVDVVRDKPLEHFEKYVRAFRRDRSRVRPDKED